MAQAIHADFWLLERVVTTQSWSPNPAGGSRDPETDNDISVCGAIHAHKIVNANKEVDDTG